MDYKTSGVDIEAGYKSVELMKEHVKRTMREEVLGGLGGFSGAFSLAKIKEMEEPVLLSGIVSKYPVGLPRHHSYCEDRSRHIAECCYHTPLIVPLPFD